ARRRPQLRAAHEPSRQWPRGGRRSGAEPPDDCTGRLCGRHGAECGSGLKAGAPSFQTWSFRARRVALLATLRCVMQEHQRIAAERFEGDVNDIARAGEARVRVSDLALPLEVPPAKPGVDEREPGAAAVVLDVVDT